MNQTQTQTKSCLFGHDFYPTPPHLIERLIEGIKWREIDSTLEPSTGKADIVSVVRDRIKTGSYRYRNDEPDIDCIEIDPALQHIIRGEGFRVVHDDFLTYETWKQYTLIIANPPFSDGDKHLLKMLDMQKRGGKVRCLLNAETIRNPYTNTRKDLVRRLTEVGAEVEYIEGAFAGAERPTGVEVALVKVDIPRSDGPSIILDDLRKAREVEDGYADASALVDSDPLRAMVEQYNFEAKAGLSLLNEFSRLRPYMLNRIEGEYRSPLLELKYDKRDATPNEFIRGLRKKYWEALFARPEFTKMLTSELRSKHAARVSELVDFEFSLYNIWTLLQQFHGQVIEGIDKAIIDLFETLSHENAWDKNIESGNVHYYNGWATNKAWKINHKVIRPNHALRKDGWDKRVKISYYGDRSLEEIADIEKVFRYLDGKSVAGLHDDRDSAIAIIIRAVERGKTAAIETEYFFITLYLKGTCHIKFKDLDLLKKFNLYGARKRQWLPPAYGKKAYSDMAPDERAVVDSFEGEAEYAKTMARPSFYLAGAEQMVAATTPQRALPMLEAEAA